MKASQQVDGWNAGTDINALESAQGKVWERASRLRPELRQVVLHRPGRERRVLSSYSTDTRLLSPTRVSDGGGAVSRTVWLTGLITGTVYYYRVDCASEQPRGSFVTKR